jgi:hypothetical protein
VEELKTTVVGRCKVQLRLTHSLKPPGFEHVPFEHQSLFQNVPFPIIQPAPLRRGVAARKTGEDGGAGGGARGRRARWGAVQLDPQAPDCARLQPARAYRVKNARFQEPRLSYCVWVCVSFGFPSLWLCDATCPGSLRLGGGEQFEDAVSKQPSKASGVRLEVGLYRLNPAD